MGLIGMCLEIDAGSPPYIVMPYMANGSLLDYLKKERNNLVLTESADDNQVNHFMSFTITKYKLEYTVGLSFCQEEVCIT